MVRHLESSQSKYFKEKKEQGLENERRQEERQTGILSRAGNTWHNMMIKK